MKGCLVRLTYTIILLCITSICASSTPWKIGCYGGAIKAHGDLGTYWHDNAGGGIEVVYPFHNRLPATLSVHFSNHKEDTNAPLKQGFKRAGRDILLIHSALIWSYEFTENRAFVPYAGLGISHTVFLMYASWPPESNSDESEYGVVSTVGFEYKPKKSLAFFSDYRMSAFLTEPEIVHFSLFRCGIRIPLERRKREK